MKIERIDTIVTCPSRNFVTVKVITDEGVHGLGDATLNGRELAVKAYLDEHVIPCLIGRDPGSIEDIWQYLYRGAYWRRGPVTMTSIAAIDMALWDIKGKLAGMPVYQLLGGRSRQGLMVYGHANGRDHAEAVEAVQKHIEEGFKAIRVQSGVPGIAKVYGVGKSKGHYEPAEKGLAPEEPWDTALYLRHTPELFRKIREAVGPEPHLLHDAHHRLTPIEAARLGKELEPYHLFWIEDRDSSREPGSVSPDPKAHDDAACRGRGLQFDLGLQGPDRRTVGRLHPRHHRPCRRHHPCAPHRRLRGDAPGAHRLSWRDRPVAGAMAAAVNFGLWVPNFGIQELMPHTDADRRSLPAQLSLRRRLPRDGRCARGSASTSTRPWRRSTLTNAHTYRSHACRMARCGTGERPDPMISKGSKRC